MTYHYSDFINLVFQIESNFVVSEKMSQATVDSNHRPSPYVGLRGCSTIELSAKDEDILLGYSLDYQVLLYEYHLNVLIPPAVGYITQ